MPKSIVFTPRYSFWVDVLIVLVLCTITQMIINKYPQANSILGGLILYMVTTIILFKLSKISIVEKKHKRIDIDKLLKTKSD